MNRFVELSNFSIQTATVVLIVASGEFIVERFVLVVAFGCDDYCVSARFHRIMNSVQH